MKRFDTIKSSLLIIFFLLCFTFHLRAQPPHIIAGIDRTDFYAIQKAVNQYYADNPSADGYKQWKRKEYYLQTRLGENGTIINSTLRNTREWGKYLKTYPPNRTTPHGLWTFKGPSSINDPDPNDESGFGLGRLNVIRIHPTISETIYVGSASGGIWKSTNGGSSWANISPYLPSLSIKDIAINPAEPDHIYILTGDGLNYSHPSIGILKSLDAGQSWQPTNAPLFTGSPRKLLMDPTNPLIQYAATSDTLYKTTDGWSTYTSIFNRGVFDFELKPNDPSTIYITTADTIQKKVGTGDWTIITDSDFASWPSPSFIHLGVTPDAPECVYAFVARWNGTVGLYRSMSAGASNTWSVQDTTITGLGGQGGYNQTLEIKDDDFEDVAIGMVWTKISRSGGVPGSWVAPVNYVHADVHNSLFRNPYLYYANDGGLFRSTPGDTIFDDLSSGLGITEIWGFAGTPLDANLYYCGTQDNGIIRRSGTNTFDGLITGTDGGNCLINYSNSDTVYVTYQFGNLRKSTNGGDSFVSVNPPGVGDFVSPLIMDPVDPEIIFLGKDTLFRSDLGGNNWINLGKPTSNGGFLKELSQGNDNRERLYAATSRVTDQKLYKLDNALSSSGNPEWLNITNELPVGTITGLATNPDNANHIYVCLSNNEPEDKIFRSFTSGSNGSWENITGTLPNVPINCIAYHDNGENNNAIYIGTDIGVFYRDDDLGDWIYFSNFMPVVSVHDLYINTASNIIAAGTYGRGIWASETYSACVNDLSLSSAPGYPIGGVRYYSVGNSIESTAEYRTDAGTEIYYSGGDFLDLKVGFKAGGHVFFNGKIGPCPSEIIPQDFQEQHQGHPFDIESWLVKNAKSN